MTLDNRPTLRYAGDVRDTVGQVVGPTLAGELLAVDQVDGLGVMPEHPIESVARLRYATPADVERTNQTAAFRRFWRLFGRPSGPRRP